MDTDNELRAEQEVVDRLYARLDELRSVARTRLAAVRRAGPSGSPQNRSERDAFATMYEDRVAQLDSVEDRLAFGRLDLEDGALRYVGRIGLNHDDHSPMLTDWRAPAAQPFYRATAAHPDGVIRRRHLISKGRTVTAVEDELLNLDAATKTSGLSGEGALFAAMSAGRTGRMGDIVSTIQAEQDTVIRSPLSGALVVQGGPGTGKTAVALHRAAYLLYSHRKTLERSGVLLIGPSRSFLRYIDQVLPSLGETGVVNSTLADLVPQVRVDAEDEPAVVAIKGRQVFAEIVARAVRARQRVPEADVRVRLDGQDLTIRREDVRAAIGKARRSHKPHNQARVVFVREMLSRLARQVEADQGSALGDEDRAVLLEDMRSNREIRVALNIAWFPLTPQRLISDLFTKPHRLREAAPELTRQERRLLARPVGHGWTLADIPLLDEAAELLGEDDSLDRSRARAAERQRQEDREYARQVLESTGAGGGIVDAATLAERFSAPGSRLTVAERAVQDRRWTYGHVVVDEAQELSVMAWRMLVRRCPTRSMTIVGDIAQTSSPAGAHSWARHLDQTLRGHWRETALTINYRTPERIIAVATALAREAGLPTSPLTSARDVPDAMETVSVAAPGDTEGLLDAVHKATEAARTRYVHGTTGRIAVIAPPDLADALTSGSVPLEAVRGPDVDAPVVVLVPQEAKGLEYDAVVLVEPTVLAEGPSGPSDLYVAMTRPTMHLTVVHSRPLPAAFDA